MGLARLGYHLELRAADVGALDRIFSIASREQHLDLRLQPAHLPGKHDAVHAAWHDQVGEQQVVALASLD